MGKGSSGHKGNEASKRKRAIYKAEARYFTNKVRKLKKVIKNHPNDACAVTALKRVLKADN